MEAFLEMIFYHGVVCPQAQLSILKKMDIQLHISLIEQCIRRYHQSVPTENN